MEINVTRFVEELDCSEFSDSVFNSGNPNIGQVTWENSRTEAEDAQLVTAEADLDEVRNYFAGYGAWDGDEIEGWTTEDLNALLIQDIASAVKEYESFDSYEEYAEAAEQGRVRGQLYRGDNGQWYFYVGH